jgi:hypothetical protein
MNDVHLPVHTPFWELDACREVDDLVVWPVKFYVQVLDNGVPEPLNIVSGPCKEIMKIFDPVLVHEAFQPASLYIIIVRFPDEFALHVFS